MHEVECSWRVSRRARRAAAPPKTRDLHAPIPGTCACPPRRRPPPHPGQGDVTACAPGQGARGLRSGPLIPLAIPSPSSPYIFRVGALQPRWYGLLLACGVLLAGWMARREFRRRRIDPALAYTIAVWTVPFGLVGARLYHVITDWGSFWPHHLADTPKIWQGGLGIWG